MVLCQNGDGYNVAPIGAIYMLNWWAMPDLVVILRLRVSINLLRMQSRLLFIDDPQYWLP